MNTKTFFSKPKKYLAGLALAINSACISLPVQESREFTPIHTLNMEKGTTYDLVGVIRDKKENRFNLVKEKCELYWGQCSETIMYLQPIRQEISLKDFFKENRPLQEGSDVAVINGKKLEELTLYDLQTADYSPRSLFAKEETEYPNYLNVGTIVGVRYTVKKPFSKTKYKYLIMEVKGFRMQGKIKHDMEVEIKEVENN